MIVDDVRAMAFEPIKQCDIAITRRMPIGRGLTASVRLPSGQVVVTFCSLVDDSDLLVTVTTDPHAPRPDSPSSVRADDVGLVQPLVQECALRLKARNGKAFERDFLSKDGKLSIRDVCTRMGRGVSVILKAKRSPLRPGPAT